MKLLRISIVIVGLVTISGFLNPRVSVPETEIEALTKPPFLNSESQLWVDSVFSSLSDDERIAQLFMVAAYSNKGESHKAKITKLIKEQKIGGLIFFQGGPVRQAALTNYYQSISKTPLLISIDGEWGLAMRLDSTTKFPYQMTLGAIADNKVIYEMGREIGRQCKRIGIHVNLAPVVDVNVNPKNPVIGFRSFGEDKHNVAAKGVSYMKGMQDVGVMANAKHFPGHGDTDKDSHKALPFIYHSKERMDSVELFPFKKMINSGLSSVMVAHLYIPSYDTTANTATTLSKNVVTDLLKNDLGFEGLVFTDALNMKGVSAYFEPGVVDVKALLAGNDVLLFPENIPTAIAEIKKVVASGGITMKEINRRCKKILAAKYWAGLHDFKPIKLEGIYEDLNTPHADLLQRKLTESALTLLTNKNQLIPLQKLDTLRIASVSIGAKANNEFQASLQRYHKVDLYSLPKRPDEEECSKLLKELEPYNLIIYSVHNTSNRIKSNFGITSEAMKLLDQINTDKKKKVILDLFANPYCLGKFKVIEKVDALIMSYQDTRYSRDLSGQLIFGGITASGRLPVTSSFNFPVNYGIMTDTIIRLKYTIPEEVGIDSRQFYKVDSIALDGIENMAYPGCQILVAKNGKVIYRRAYGNHTYDKKRKVLNTDLYDLASITKISATLPSVMRLSDESKISIENNLCDYLEDVQGTNKFNVNLKEILAHQAGLKPWIPFYLRTVKNGKPDTSLYQKTKTDSFPYLVAKKLYMHKDYPDVMFNRILESKMLEEKEYKYSDLGYYFFKRIIEEETGASLDNYVDSVFYQPMGLTTMCFNPLDRGFNLSGIIPTEYDVGFRKQLVHGYVHDPGSAMMGGVGGHAGVFSNSNDLAKLMQMYLQWGVYGGQRYISGRTLWNFSKCQFCDDGNRRGAGFDKPQMDETKISPTCRCVSPNTFGHTGFTGTATWVDPEHDLIYIFLSNRIYPDANNRKLIKMNIRTNIQQVIYEMLDRSKGNS